MACRFIPVTSVTARHWSRQASNSTRSSRPPAPSVKRRFRVEAAGSSGAGLHAKTFAFDRRIGFVGSYNLDPRSSRLNTEMGVLFDCPALAKRLPEETERDLASSAYRVELDGRRLVWVTREGDKEVRYTSEPDASLRSASKPKC